MNVVFFDLEEQRPKGFLTLAEAADLWHLHRDTIRDMTLRGELPSVKIFQRIYVPEDAIYGVKGRDPIMMMGTIMEGD